MKNKFKLTEKAFNVARIYIAFFGNITPVDYTDIQDLREVQNKFDADLIAKSETPLTFGDRFQNMCNNLHEFSRDEVLNEAEKGALWPVQLGYVEMCWDKTVGESDAAIDLRIEYDYNNNCIGFDAPNFMIDHYLRAAIFEALMLGNTTLKHDGKTFNIIGKKGKVLPPASECDAENLRIHDCISAGFIGIGANAAIPENYNYPQHGMFELVAIAVSFAPWVNSVAKWLVEKDAICCVWAYDIDEPFGAEVVKQLINGDSEEEICKEEILSDILLKLGNKNVDDVWRECPMLVDYLAAQEHDDDDEEENDDNKGEPLPAWEQVPDGATIVRNGNAFDFIDTDGITFAKYYLPNQ